MQLNRITKARAGQIRRKGKKLLAFTIMAWAASAIATRVKAQTMAEWFDQNSTQRQYLIKQIVVLKVYATFVKQGNDIAHKGLGAISGSLKAENNAHAAYYTSMKQVNPVVRNNKQVSDIMQWQKDILSRINGLNGSAGLSADERSYTAQVTAALLKDCNEEMHLLQMLVSDGKLQMNDAERLKGIGLIHRDMQENYLFAADFADQLKVYAVQQQTEKNNIAAEKKIYGIH